MLQDGRALPAQAAAGNQNMILDFENKTDRKTEQPANDNK
jgi:hypothetical protein